MNKYFKLFANCVAVKGVSRSTICDLQKGRIHIVPNTLTELLEYCDNDSFFSVVKNYNYDEKEAFGQLEDLRNLELGFWTKEPELYPKLNLEFESPSVINNSIIEIDDNSVELLEKAINELTQLRCKNIELRAYRTNDVEKVDSLLKMINKSYIRSVQLYLIYSEKLIVKEIVSLLNKYPRITNIVIHSCPSNLMEINERYSSSRLFFTEQKVSDGFHCGNISRSYFKSNITVFSEAKTHNSCLNKKISVNNQGEIMNCPAMGLHFGNIYNDSLVGIAKKNDFQKVWNIDKSQIDTCKDCEFRLVCTDCRAILEDQSNLYSKPLKCSYNPYTNKWETSEKNKLIKKIIKRE